MIASRLYLLKEINLQADRSPCLKYHQRLSKQRRDNIYLLAKSVFWSFQHRNHKNLLCATLCVGAQLSWVRLALIVCDS